MIDWMRAKGAEYFGKLGIVGGVTSEAGKAAGILENVSMLQLISAAGIMWLLVDRSIRLIWDAKEKGDVQFKIAVTVQSTMWITLISLLLVAYK